MFFNKRRLIFIKVCCVLGKKMQVFHIKHGSRRESEPFASRRGPFRAQPERSGRKGERHGDIGAAAGTQPRRGEDIKLSQREYKPAATGIKIRRGGEQNYFQGFEIYFSGLEIYFKGVKIYFQATEKVFIRGAQGFMPCGGTNVAVCQRESQTFPPRSQMPERGTCCRRRPERS